MATPFYYEIVDNQSPGSFAISPERSEATLSLDVLDAVLDDSFTDLLGDVDRTGSGGLKRKLPKAHPRMPWMFASSINGVGLKFTGKVASEPYLEAPALPYYGEYQRYRLTVKFEPKPYRILGDESVSISSLTWIPESGGSGTQKYFANEWVRYTDYEIVPQNELLTAQQGQMRFYTASGTKPNNVGFSGFPRMIMKKGLVKFRWYQVPYTYVDHANSYIANYVGYVNQRDWLRWKKGELLYLGANVRRYTPHSPSIDFTDYSQTWGVEKLADIEFLFLYTKRDGTDLPTLSNGNYIVAGHNLQPWLYTRQYYYAGNSPSTSNKAPCFPSFPFELFFTDPAI